MKIICIGRNYKDHAKELNNPIPEFPVFFLKPPTALLPAGNDFPLPDFSREVHYEVEIVMKINSGGSKIPASEAHKYYDEISAGIDFTARDLQNQCKKKGHPWEIAKAFDFSAPVGQFISKSSIADMNALHFKLLKNSTVVQSGNTRDMLFSFDFIISYVSKFKTQEKGDLIFTGTPSGVGNVGTGDKLEAFIEGKSLLSLSVR